MADVRRVLVVGGGISGLTLAAALHRAGVGVEVVEREPRWSASGAGLSVQPNGLRVLHGLGLQSAVVEAGQVVDRWVFADQDGNALCDIDLAGVWGDVGPFVGIARPRLQDVLVAGADAVPCRLGTTVTSIEERPEAVSVTFTDGSSADYDLVVGADGIRSTVRRLVFGPNEPTFAGQLSWRSISPIRLPRAPSVEFWLGTGTFFGLCSVDEERTYGFGYVYEAQRIDPLEGRLERLRARFDDYGPTVREYLAALEKDEQVYVSWIEWVSQDPWHTDRVVLIGDAAHASSPMMGQGGSLAMEDAHVLTELLQSERTVSEALAAHEARRRPRVRWVQQQSLAIAEASTAPTEARNETFRSRGERAFLDRYLPLTAPP